MKKILLLVLVAFSTNAFVMGNPRLHNDKQIEKNPKEMIRSFRDIQSLRATGTPNAEKISDFLKIAQAQAIEYDMLDSVRNWDWDSETENWKNSNKINMKYDAKNRLISYVDQEWDEDAEEWGNSIRTTNTYNTSDLLISQIMEGWDGSDWVNFMKSTSNYDENKNLTT